MTEPKHTKGPTRIYRSGMNRQQFCELVKTMPKDKMLLRLLDEYEELLNEKRELSNRYHDLRDAVIDSAWEEARRMVEC